MYSFSLMVKSPRVVRKIPPPRWIKNNSSESALLKYTESSWFGTPIVCDNKEQKIGTLFVNVPDDVMQFVVNLRLAKSYHPRKIVSVLDN